MKSVCWYYPFPEEVALKDSFFITMTMFFPFAVHVDDLNEEEFVTSVLRIIR